MKPDKKKRLEAAGWVVSDDPDELFRPKEQAMSKLDELLDWIDGDDYGTPIMLGKEARTELAALRRRAEDAEMIVRCYSHTWVYYFGTGETLCMVTVKPATLEAPETYRTALHRDLATGLPILNDEARKAMQPPPTT